MDDSRITELLAQLSKGTIGSSDKKILEDWIDGLDREQLFRTMDSYQQMFRNEYFQGTDSKDLLSRIEQKLDDWQKQDEFRSVSIFSSKRSYFIAASVIIIVVLSTVTFLVARNKRGAALANSSSAEPKAKDVLPGGNKAILTLSNGSVITLDDAGNGALTEQGSTRVLKYNGRIAYQAKNNDTEKPVYNTISTPRGGQYQIELSDGSVVWLNSASSIRFPTVFTGDERRVEITGEAYFEVARNPSKPFITSIGNAQVRVFGTHFNVMAYQDEGVIKTTLLEGSVEFEKNGKRMLLKPGQQSQVRGDEMKLLDGVNLDEQIAWKDGFFDFESESLKEVTRQLSRWYNVDVVYTGTNAHDLLHAKFPRNTKLSDALKVLELAGTARFQLDGTKLIVK